MPEEWRGSPPAVPVPSGLNLCFFRGRSGAGDPRRRDEGASVKPEGNEQRGRPRTRQVFGDQLDRANEQHRIEQPGGFLKSIESGGAGKDDRRRRKSDASNRRNRALIRQAERVRDRGGREGDEPGGGGPREHRRNREPRQA